MTDDYAGYNALSKQYGVERLGAGLMLVASKAKHKSAAQRRDGRASSAQNWINKLYGVERDLKAFGDAERQVGRHQQSYLLS